jgi:hypothetical protein
MIFCSTENQNVKDNTPLDLKNNTISDAPNDVPLDSKKKFFFNGEYSPEIIPHVINNTNLTTADLKNLNNIGFSKVIIKKIEDQLHYYIESERQFYFKKNSSDPFGLGNEMNQRLSSIYSFKLLIDSQFCSKSLLNLIKSNYEKNYRKLNIHLKPLNKDEDLSDALYLNLHFQEDKVSVSKICLFPLNEVPENTLKRIKNFHNTKEVNFFLEGLATFMDSLHFRVNDMRQGNEFLNSAFQVYGYLSSRIIHQTWINAIDENNVIKNSALVYSVSPGDKYNIQNILIETDSLSPKEKENIKNYLNLIYKDMKISLMKTSEINKLLKKFNCECYSCKIRNVNGDSCDISFSIDKTIKKKYIQNILIKEIYGPISKILNTIANVHNIYISAQFDEMNANRMNHWLKEISGTEINMQLSQQSGIIINATGGAKPSVFKYGDNLFRVNYQGFIITPFQLQWYFIYNQICKYILKPEISLTAFRNLQIAVNSSLEYYTENGIILKLEALLPIPIISMITNIFKPNYIKKDIDVSSNLAFSLNYQDHTFEMSFSKQNNTQNIIDNLLMYNDDLYKLHRAASPTDITRGKERYALNFKNTKWSDVFLPNIFQLSYTYKSNLIENSFEILGYEYDIKSIFGGRGFEGLPLSARIQYEAEFLGNTINYCLLGSYSPIVKTPNSLLALQQEYRIIGLKEDYCRSKYGTNGITSSALCIFRFFIFREIWNSAQVIMRLMSLNIGLFFNIAYFNRYIYGDVKEMKIQELFIKSKINTVCYWGNLFNALGLILILDLMGMMSIFVAICFYQFYGLCIDFGIIAKRCTTTQQSLQQKFI